MMRKKMPEVSKEQLYIWHHEDFLTIPEIGLRLQLTPHSVRKLFRQKEVTIVDGRQIVAKKKGHTILSDVEKELVIARYELEGATLLAKEIGKDPKQIMSYANSKGCRSLNRFENRSLRSKTVNPHFFDVLGGDQFYVAGFCTADAGVRNGCLCLKNKTLDEDILFKILESMSSHHKVTRIPYHVDKDGRCVKPSTRSTICNSKLVEALRDKFGIVERKSQQNILFPDTVSDLGLPHYARGLMDGDGSILTRSPGISFLGSKNLMEGLQNRLSEAVGIRPGTVSRDDSIYRFTWQRRSDVHKLYRFLYSAGIYGYRKRRLLEWILSIPLADSVSREFVHPYDPVLTAFLGDQQVRVIHEGNRKCVVYDGLEMRLIPKISLSNYCFVHTDEELYPRFREED